MKQYVVTPAAGKRLIAKAVAGMPEMQKALKTGTVVVIAGTTNGYVAEEILSSLGETGFRKERFFRGVTLPPGSPLRENGRMPDESRFPGDVVIVKGARQKGGTIFDVADSLGEGDVIIKGANAVDPATGRAGILIGHPKGGTTAAALQAAIGRRVRFILPVGLEKRVSADLEAIAGLLNKEGGEGPRFWPVPGEVITELQAVNLLTGACAELVAAGGVGGAEGSVRLAVSGTEEQEKAADKVLGEALSEPAFFDAERAGPGGAS